MSDKRRLLTALRKECKSAGKERRKEIQALIAELEACSVEADNPVDQEKLQQEQEQEEQQRLRVERERTKRREKEAEAAAERERLVQEAKKRIDAGPQLNVTERLQFEELLRTNNLHLHLIDPDGNCLFAAVSHQLSLYNINISQQRLRGMTADYIVEHADNYSPFIDFTEHSVSGLQGYVELVRKSGWWGGDLELDAMAQAIPAHIRVFKADGIVSFNDSCDTVLLLSFHRHQYTLGAHYNSLLKNDPNE